MSQSLSQTPAPLAPPAPLPGNRTFSGEDLGRIVKQAVGGTLTSVRNGLQEELDRAIARRDGLQAEIADLPRGAARDRLDSRLDETNLSIQKLRSAIDKLESGISDVGDATPVVGAPFSPPPLQRNDFNPETMIISIMVILFVAFPLALTFARLMWKRATNTQSQPALPADTTRRFDRLEQSVDSIAIEIERISENQRYLTKLLAEPRPGAAVSSGRQVE